MIVFFPNGENLTPIEKNFEWIKGVIKSCTNSFQLACCNVLLDRFRELYGDGNPYKGELLQAIIDQAQKWSIEA